MNVVRMKVELRQIVVDEPLGGLGREHALSTYFPTATEFWIYRVGGKRSRRWTLTDPKAASRVTVPLVTSAVPSEPESREERTTPLTSAKAPAGIGQGANDARVPTSRQSVTSQQEQSA